MIGITRRQWLLGAGAGALLAGVVVRLRCRQAVAAAERRLSGRSRTVMTAFGTVEYAVAGTGPPLLMVHGTGGGFDQGLGFAAALRRRGYRIIAPSRFGYLRSDFPAEPSLANQADTFAALLDHLRIDRLAVIGGSAGALSASAFALRHPDRCAALVLLVPAANVSGRDPVAMGDVQRHAIRALLGSNLLYWSALELAPEWLIGTILATDPALLRTVSASERRRAFGIASDIMPIDARTRGMLNDASQASDPAPLDYGRLRPPTLLISAEDDRFGTAATARAIAAMVKHAELTILSNGGHIWLGHDEAVATRIAEFLGRA
ncbi:alpha/beta fold hydrolase [Polymorphobacter sp.]|uniref:alpha/beta fold hydrolase n=1 Tax=Polymorphobacter sp. TaxID=1909290 RepID=UPI003F6FFA04